jgi:hypothetical protein
MSNGSRRRSADNSSDVQRSAMTDNHAKGGDHGLNTASREQLISVYGTGGSHHREPTLRQRPRRCGTGIISENTFAQLRKDLLLGNLRPLSNEPEQHGTCKPRYRRFRKNHPDAMLRR